MKKKGLLITFSIILVITAGLTVTGILYNAKINAQPSFTGEYDINHNQPLYVMKADETEILYLQGENGGVHKLYEADENLKIMSPVFTGESEVSFILTDGPPEAPPGEQEFQLVHSNVLTYDVEEEELTTNLEARGYITNLLYDQAEQHMIVSGVHVSTEGEPEPGFISFASALYTLTKDGNFEKIHDFDAYEPGSLQITENGEKLYMILPDDFEDVSPDSMFEATERIYEMAIDQPKEMTVVSQPDNQVPISEFVLLEQENKLLYQTIMNFNEGENYLYDYVWFDLTNQEEGERLHIDEASENAKTNENWLYYTKTTDKADQTKVYKLYRYDLLRDTGEEEIELRVEPEE
ncbi:hypothetical protein [Gracilibacillus phocaeensis]|uniref:hypothetical protein n=1 Tax=Gracilibacillus phocaeensis TaxID=2042304 RepID=UPI0010319FB2|nr:hypothetical protein [Gracilibacillus phocaeensis]